MTPSAAVFSEFLDEHNNPLFPFLWVQGSGDSSHFSESDYSAEENSDLCTIESTCSVLPLYKCAVILRLEYSEAFLSKYFRKCHYCSKFHIFSLYY